METNRKTAKVTGSTLHKAVGLDTLKKQLEHYERIFKNQEETDMEEATKERLRYGIENEINALATLLSKVLPSFYPHTYFYEEGFIVLKNDEDSNIMVVSPDGSGKAG